MFLFSFVFQLRLKGKKKIIGNFEKEKNKGKITSPHSSLRLISLRLSSLEPFFLHPDGEEKRNRAKSLITPRPSPRGMHNFILSTFRLLLIMQDSVNRGNNRFIRLYSPSHSRRIRGKIKEFQHPSEETLACIFLNVDLLDSFVTQRSSSNLFYPRCSAYFASL